MREFALPPLPLTPLEPVEWQARCPCCLTPETVDAKQEDSGAWSADGPDRYPVCDHCGLQYEVASVYVRQERDA